MTRSVSFVLGSLVLAASLAGACGGGGGDDTPVDAADPAIDAPPITPDAEVPTGPGSQTDPAASCAELLKVVGAKSGTYWVKHPEGKTDPFPVYCEQDLNGGGWAMVFNSVRTVPGTTLPFWQIPYAARLDRKGVRARNENYYDGALYQIGKEYMDVIVDLNFITKIAVVATTAGIDPVMMKFVTPVKTTGSDNVFSCHFASGWASTDRDYDPDPTNCAAAFGGVTQHYCGCWYYNLGHDADVDGADGSVGPHVNDSTLGELGLSRQTHPNNTHSQVSRIARFTRW